MINAFTEILRSWQTFYFTIGGAAAALLGLMFVAVSLALPVITTGISADMKAFVNPSVYYFVSELALVFVMLVPSYDPLILGLLLIVGGVPGLVVTLRHARQLVTVALKNQDFVLGDWLAQIILPVVAYLLIGVRWRHRFCQHAVVIGPFLSCWIASVPAAPVRRLPTRGLWRYLGCRSR